MGRQTGEGQLRGSPGGTPKQTGGLVDKRPGSVTPEALISAALRGAHARNTDQKTTRNINNHVCETIFNSK